MNLEKLKEMALDVVKDTTDHEKTVQTLNDIVKYAESQDLELRSVKENNTQLSTQLEKARETNLKLFEQVTIDKTVEKEVDDQVDSKPLSEKDILTELGGNMDE